MFGGQRAELGGEFVRKLAVLLLFGILLAVTNPSMGEFQTYSQDHVVQEINRSGDHGVVQAAKAVKNLTGFDATKWYADKLLASARRDDYVILSVYSAKIDDREHIWVGAFRRFVKLK